MPHPIAVVKSAEIRRSIEWRFDLDIRRVPRWTRGLAVACVACHAPPCDAVSPGVTQSCAIPGWTDRDIDLRPPDRWDGVSPVPVLLALHGGGGDRTSAARVGCPGGDPASPGCLSVVAGNAGFAVVYADGTRSRVGNLRTWNAGGGADGWQCVSGRACAEGVDDLAYLDAVRAVVEGLLPVDGWYATGHSNGGAMAYRLACARSEVFRGIAPTGAGNQSATAPGCAPTAPVAILDLHGTADPCWAYGGGPAACLQTDGGAKIGVEATLTGTPDQPGWTTHLGCDGGTRVSPVPDRADDGMHTDEITYTGCRAPLVHLKTWGGGHTVPGGEPTASVRLVGPVTEDFLANERIVQFLLTVRTDD
jgi:polyhydroxybutyrate depolymerase